MTHSDPVRLPKYAGSIRAILAATGDDLPRLVLADELEADGYPERAEFITVQVELATRGCAEPCLSNFQSYSRCDKCKRIPILRNRERELFKPLFGPSDPHYGHYSANEAWVEEGGTRLHFRRGFISHVRLPFTAWYGGACERCGGDGSPYIGIDGSRAGRCPLCGATEPTGTVEGIGPRMCAEHPITGVEVVGKEPRANRHGGEQVSWQSYAVGGEGYIPLKLLRLMPGYENDGELWLFFLNRKAALDALGVALIAQAKSVTSATHKAPAAPPQPA